MGKESEEAEEAEVVETETEAEEGAETEAEEGAETIESEAEKSSEPEGEATLTGDEADEVTVTIGDAPAPDEGEKKAPEWVKKLRKANRETQRENRELKKKLDAMNTPAKAETTLGAKPELADFDYDTQVYDAKLSAWYDKRREVEQQQADNKTAQADREKEWQLRLDDFEEKKSKLKVSNFDDAEAAVLGALDETQQAIVVQGADNAALVFCALGSNDSKLKELATIKDPVKFSFAVAKLETQLKVKNRKAPPPEKTVSGTAPKSGAVDSELNRLREEAERTGDYSKIHKYKKLRRQAKK